MKTLTVNLVDYTKSLLVKTEKVKISKTDSEWNSLSKSEKISEIRYLIGYHEKKAKGYFIVSKILKYFSFIAPVVLFTPFLGFGLVLAISSLGLIGMTSFLASKIFNKKSILSVMEYNIFTDCLDKEISEYGK